ncbi:MAG: hypothetical protein ACYDFT_06030, partial [Thermoplasmata archaeon]
LLLVLIDPFVGLLFPVGGWQYPLLTIPILAVAAPLLVYAGCRRAQRDAPAGGGPAAPHLGRRSLAHRRAASTSRGSLAPALAFHPVRAAARRDQAAPKAR